MFLQLARFSAVMENLLLLAPPLLERHGHTEGNEGLVKMPPLRKRWQTAPFAGVQL